MDFSSEITKIRDELQQQRDEIQVQIHLAKLESMVDWERAERLFEKIESRLGALTVEVVESGDDILASARLLAEEIRAAYRRIRRQF